MESPILLFADESGFWVGIAGVIAAIVAGVIAILRGRNESKDQQARRDTKARRDAMNELYDLIDRQAEDLQSARQEVHELRDQLNEVKIKLAVCEVQHAEKDRQMRIVMSALRKAGIAVDLSPSGPSSSGPQPIAGEPPK